MPRRLRIAMPVAHVITTPNYVDYYAGDNCVLRAAEYFNVNNCEGIRLERDPAAPTTLANSIWDLYAFTDGFLSFQNNSLVLRLPLELNKAPNNIYNSGELFGQLGFSGQARPPRGPQLRRVVYRFDMATGAAISDKIRAILADTTHPGRGITRVFPIDAVDPTTLGNFIEVDPANLDLVALDFMAGYIELFVRAGDIIGNFFDHSIQLSFHDSCLNPTFNPAPPSGRALSPAYFLYLVRIAVNASRVTMLTALVPATPNPPNTMHPLYFLLEPARLTAANVNPNLGVDLTAVVPPPPLHLRVPVQNAAGVNIAGYGIPIRDLGEWHESRNDPAFLKKSPVRWRLYGNQASDTNANNFGRFITEVKPGKQNLLPNPGAFDHQFEPEAVHTTLFKEYWDRYRSIINLVSEEFQLPLELIFATACTETATGPWYNNTFANSHEMDVIRMEPVSWYIELADAIPTIDQVAALITTDAGNQTRLSGYMNLAGLRVYRRVIVNGKKTTPLVASYGPNGANPNMPVPWAPNVHVPPSALLTWDSLGLLIEAYPKYAQVSPGVMQTLVTTALEDLKWGESFYGTGYVDALNIVHNGVTLIADNPPASLSEMFSDWFAVTVNATGTATTPADAELTRMKRAMHSIIAGTMHIKRRYNVIESKKNIVTDFDLPTSFSGFNDGAQTVPPAAPGASNQDKWHLLFTLRYFDDNYPNNAPRFYNAAINYFNTTANLDPLPAVRLWRG